jgi:hypothetical protein
MVKVGDWVTTAKSGDRVQVIEAPVVRGSKGYASVKVRTADGVERYTMVKIS